jgi:hypothetical protein
MTEIEEVHDGGWPALTGLMVQVARAIQDLYAQEGCETGGPLHVVVDDDNVNDTSLVGCARFCDPDDWAEDRFSDEVYNLSIAILWGLSAMTEIERLVVVEMAHGWPTVLGYPGEIVQEIVDDIENLADEVMAGVEGTWT